VYIWFRQPTVPTEVRTRQLSYRVCNMFRPSWSCWRNNTAAGTTLLQCAQSVCCHGRQQAEGTNSKYKNTLGFDPRYSLAKQTLIYSHLTLRKYPMELYSPSKWRLVHLYQPLCSRRMALKFRKPSPDCATGGAPSSEAKLKRGIKMQNVQIKVHLTQLNCTTIMDHFTKTFARSE